MAEKRVATFGEVMMRLTAPGFMRFAQARSFNVIYAGGELNAAIALASLGVPADFVTRLPKNDLGDACINYIRQFGVGVDKIVRGGDRLGVYFVEIGAAQRGNKVIYDRAGSAVAAIMPGMIDWAGVFSDIQWFHWTGITPALSEGAADICLEGVKVARDLGLTVSCDLNYRGKLWKWGKTPGEVMPELVKYADILIGNEEDADNMFGIRAPEVDVAAGKVEAGSYRFVAEKLMERFPNLQLVAISLRGSISASHNTWSAVSWDGKVLYKAPVYDITHIVDRIGAGDAFAGGLIFGMLNGDNHQDALNRAVAVSCLKHTLYGDSCVIKPDEVESLMRGVVSGRISR